MPTSSKAVPISGQNQPITIDPKGIRLHAPGLVGQVVVQESQDASTRFASRAIHAESFAGIDSILQESACASIRKFELAIEENPQSWTGTRSMLMETVDRMDAPITLEVPREEDMNYAVLVYDEEDGYAWVLPNEMPQARSTIMPSLGFKLPKPQTLINGGIKRVGRALIRLIAWPAKDFLGGQLAGAITKWEKKKRKYGLWQIDPNKKDFTDRIQDWDGLTQGRVLLMIHGTFGTLKSSFDDLINKVIFNEIQAYYENRVIGFNHPSLYHDARQNVSKLFSFLEKQLPENRNLKLDILTSSRGGLVGREFIRQVLERSQPLSGRIEIDRAILVAAPNRGTALADGKNLGNLINRYTNLLSFLPLSVFSVVLELLIELVKVAAVGALEELPGLKCQSPEGPYVSDLNTSESGQVKFHAITSDFTPASGGWLRLMGKRFRDENIDRVFGEPNDGVVPTIGAFDTAPLKQGPATGTSYFSVAPENRRVFNEGGSIHHLNYFGVPDVNRLVFHWLHEGR